MDHELMRDSMGAFAQDFLLREEGPPVRVHSGGHIPMSPLPYVVIVFDGVSIRTLHPRAFGPDLPQLETLIRRALAPPSPENGHGFRPLPTPPPSTDTLTQRKIATASGYTGNACQSCGSFSMRRSGTCETCEGCGSTSGGCS